MSHQFPVGDALAAFQFYEAASERTKAHAWAQTSWVLALVAASLGFAVKSVVEHPCSRHTSVIQLVCLCATLALCFYLLIVLRELGTHIRGYWTQSNRLGARYAELASFIGEKDAKAAQAQGYRAKFPRFIVWLMVPALLFVVGHAFWAAYVSISGGPMAEPQCQTMPTAPKSKSSG